MKKSGEILVKIKELTDECKAIESQVSSELYWYDLDKDLRDYYDDLLIRIQTLRWVLKDD